MAEAIANDDESTGEGYFASVSDLMVGILFIFLLMLTILALNYRDAEQEQVVALERYEVLRAQTEEARRRAEEQEAEARRLAQQVAQALEEAERERAEAVRQTELAQRAAAEAEALRARNEQLQVLIDAVTARLLEEIREREQTRAELLERLAAEMAARGITVRIDLQSGVLRLSEDVPFATGRSELGERARRTVQILAEVLAQVLPCFAHGGDRSRCGPRDSPILEAVLIEGHTDQQAFAGMTPEQSILENDRLSAARALSVFAELRRLQAPLEALRNAEGVPLLGLSGYGQRRPVAQGSTEAAFALNRRIDLRFVLSARTSEEVQRLIGEVDALRRSP